jgi:hypothetical protein
MDAITQYKSKTSLNSDVRVLWISTDMLALVPYEEMYTANLIKREWLLIEGINFNGGYLITNEITQKCYNARETGVLYTFEFDSITVEFK